MLRALAIHAMKDLALDDLCGYMPADAHHNAWLTISDTK